MTDSNEKMVKTEESRHEIASDIGYEKLCGGHACI